MTDLTLPIGGTITVVCGLALLAQRWRLDRQRRQLQGAHLADISALHEAFAIERAGLTRWPCGQCPRPQPPATILVDGVGILPDGQRMRVRYPICAACYALLLSCWLVPPSARPLRPEDWDTPLHTDILDGDDPAALARIAARN